MDHRRVSVLQGDTFVVSDGWGDMSDDAGRSEGLFYRDMRHLSRWLLRLNDHQPDVLSGSAVEYDEAAFFFVEPPGMIHRNPDLSIIRRREVATGMSEIITADNHSGEDVSLEVSLHYAADFADLLEVEEQRIEKAGDHYWREHSGGVLLGYRNGDFCRETFIEADGAVFTGRSLTFRATVQPGRRWTAKILVHVALSPGRMQARQPHRPQMAVPLEDWLEAAPRLETDWCDLRRIYRQSLVDLAALRFHPDLDSDASLPAAGLPWFMALFGRDSLMTSYQTLPFAPDLARTALHTLAERQATEHDDFRDAEPGKILHELRLGELTRVGQRPQSPYYGSADSTPLFLILLDEYERWTADTATVRDLEPNARAALRWMDDYGDLDGDGYLEYRSRNPDTGLENHCWKDSANSIVHPDGRPVSLPRATCELQGYAYDARIRSARLAREVWQDEELAASLEDAADRLRRRFNEDFWLADTGYYALALDGDKKPVPTLASNMGHLLWSGIVPPERANMLAEHLCGKRMFSGWGVRTLATGQQAYHPVGYHTGTVWPHDTALIAAGLARYGLRDHANSLAVAMLEAALCGGGARLPEAFAGYSRDTSRIPVMYPTACYPQAWSSGAPLLLLRVLLGLEPGRDGLHNDPVVPEWIRRVRLTGVPCRNRRYATTTG